MDRNRGDNKQLGANRYSNQDYSGYDRVNHDLSASQDKKEDKMTHLQMMLLKNNKPSVQVEVEVVDVQESRYKQDQASSPRSDNNHSTNSIHRRNYQTQTNNREMKDAYTDSRSLSAERFNMQSTSQADIPAPLSVLPMAILERPSLEDGSDIKKSINLKVDAVS